MQGVKRSGLVPGAGLAAVAAHPQAERANLLLNVLLTDNTA